MDNAIVIVHSGDQPYARLCVRAALRHGNVVLIAPAPLGEGERWVDSKAMADLAGDDLGLFNMVGMEPWRIEFERRCFDRWVLAREWMNASDTRHALFIDSDVLLIKHPQLVWGDVFDASTKDQAVGMWAVSVAMLSDCIVTDLCDNFLRLHRATCGGWPVNDMVAFDTIAKVRRVNDMSLPNEGWVVDHNIHCSHGWVVEPERGDKAIEWEGGIPHATTCDGHRIKLCNLHLWSDRKEKMQEYYDKAYGS